MKPCDFTGTDWFGEQAMEPICVSCEYEMTPFPVREGTWTYRFDVPLLLSVKYSSCSCFIAIQSTQDAFLAYADVNDTDSFCIADSLLSSMYGLCGEHAGKWREPVESIIWKIRVNDLKLPFR